MKYPLILDIHAAKEIAMFFCKKKRFCAYCFDF
jgi:hypothetical protein